jgi:hypothetical protein
MAMAVSMQASRSRSAVSMAAWRLATHGPVSASKVSVTSGRSGRGAHPHTCAMNDSAAAAVSDPSAMQSSSAGRM